MFEQSNDSPRMTFGFTGRLGLALLRLTGFLGVLLHLETPNLTLENFFTSLFFLEEKSWKRLKGMTLVLRVSYQVPNNFHLYTI